MDVLERYQVGSLILPKALVSDVDFNDLLALAEVKNIPLRLVTPGDRIVISDSSVLTVLWPPDDCQEQLAALDFNHGEHDPSNICSLVMQYDYCEAQGCITALLMADATGLSEEIMIKQGTVSSATLLKIGHHGSRFATTAEFLKLVQPQNAIIQVGKNRFGHPDYGVILRLRAIGATVWRNDKDGAVRAVPEGGRFNVFSRQ